MQMIDDLLLSTRNLRKKHLFSLFIDKTDQILIDYLLGESYEKIIKKNGEYPFVDHKGLKPGTKGHNVMEDQVLHHNTGLIIFSEDTVPRKIKKHLRFDEKGHIPAIIYEDSLKEVLTLCYMNEEALRRTIETGKVHVFRRSMGRLMMKGETSGHIQTVKGIYPDCKGKSLLIKVDQKVAACHMGYMSCYFRRYDQDADELREVAEKVFDPKDKY